MKLLDYYYYDLDLRGIGLVHRTRFGSLSSAHEDKSVAFIVVLLHGSYVAPSAVLSYLALSTG